MVDTVLILISSGCIVERIEPVMKRFAQTGDTKQIAAMLRTGREKVRKLGKNDPFAVPNWTDDFFGDALNIVEYREFYGPSTDHKPPTRGAKTSREDMKRFVEGQIPELLLRGHCVAYDAPVPARQVLTRGPLLPYLYEHSEAIERAFTGSLHGTPVPPFEAMEALPVTDLQKLSEALDAVPPPDDKAIEAKTRAGLEKLANQGGIYVTSQVAGILPGHLPVSREFQNLKTIIRLAATKPQQYTLLQVFE